MEEQKIKVIGPSFGSGPHNLNLTLFQTDAPSTPNESSDRILVVEDETCIRELTAQLLIRSGYVVDSAADGAAGWAAIQSKRFDLLITDNFMPKMTGIEMIKKLHAARIKMPVIMATAMFPQEEFRQHPWLQTVTTLIKPIGTAKLLATVKKVLRASDGGSEQTAPPN